MTSKYDELAAAAMASEDEDEGHRRVVLTPASAIKPRRVRWLWEGRVALGTLALLAGREGLGKSTFAYTIASDITRGALAGEFYGQPRAVLVCATEDDWACVIIPRLIAARADLSRVYRVEVLSSEDLHLGLSLPRDLAQVKEKAAETDAALMLLDPLTSRIDTKIDTHKDAETRRALEPLVNMAGEANMAVLGLMHHNKSGKTDPLELVMASKAFTAVARSVHTVVLDPEDESETRRLFGTPKNNLGRIDLPTKAFTIVGEPIDTEDGTAWTGRVEWLEDVAGTIADAMRSGAGDEHDRSAVGEAADWLDSYLESQGGSAMAQDAVKDGRAAGLSDAAIKRARAKLKLVAKSEGFPKRSRWYCSSESRVIRQSAHQSAQSPRGEESTALTALTGGQKPLSAQSAQLVQSAHAPPRVPCDSRTDCGNTVLGGGWCPECIAASRAYTATLDGEPAA